MGAFSADPKDSLTLNPWLGYPLPVLGTLPFQGATELGLGTEASPPLFFEATLLSPHCGQTWALLCLWPPSFTSSFSLLVPT